MKNTLDFHLQPYSSEHPDAIREEIRGFNIHLWERQADAQRVAAHIRALPPGPGGEAGFECERFNPRRGTAFYAAEISARNLSILDLRPFATNAEGQEIGVSGGGASYDMSLRTF